MPKAENRGVLISYAVDGPEKRPVLLLSNALGTTRSLWDRQIDPLSRAFRVVRYDTRGHGGSDAPAGEYTLDDLGRDALAVLDAVGADRAHVCGLSLGGMTAMWLALNAPTRIDKIVMANTAARIGTREHWQERQDHVKTRGFVELAEAAPPRWFSEDFRRRNPAVVASCQSMMTSGSRVGYAGCCAVLRDTDLREAISQIRTPALAITGAHDPVTPPTDGEFLCARIAGARQVNLDAAHFSNIEAADAFSKAVADFLQ